MMSQDAVRCKLRRCHEFTGQKGSKKCVERPKCEILRACLLTTRRVHLVNISMKALSLT